MQDIDPAEAAAMAEGAADDVAAEAAGRAAEIDPEAVPTPDAGGKSTVDALREALLSTEPAVSLEGVESPWQPEIGGPARIKRGVQKMAGIDGTPAVVDLVIGVAEIVAERAEGQ